MNKTIWTVLIVAIVLSLFNVSLIFIYRDAVTAAVSYSVGTENGRSVCSSSYTAELQKIEAELTAKGEIQMFGKLLTVKQDEE